MNDSIVHRLQVVIEESGMTVSQFASKIGFKQGNLSLIMNGKRNADNKNLINSISKTFGIREEWLRYGSGSRFVAGDSSNVPQSVSTRMLEYLKYKNLTANRLEGICKLGNGTLGKLSDKTRESTIDRIIEHCQDLNRVWLLTGEGDMLVQSDTVLSQEATESDKIYYTYLIPMSAMAGSLVGFDADGVRPTDCERIVSPIAGVDFAISVYGDSMMPEFPSGSRVLIKRIDPTIYIDWGNVFVLDTTNGIILKEVQPSPKEGLLTCHSLNLNGRYKDFDVPMCEIRAMYKVLACVSLR